MRPPARQLQDDRPDGAVRNEPLERTVEGEAVDKPVRHEDGSVLCEEMRGEEGEARHTHRRPSFGSCWKPGGSTSGCVIAAAMYLSAAACAALSSAGLSAPSMCRKPKVSSWYRCSGVMTGSSAAGCHFLLGAPPNLPVKRF